METTIAQSYIPPHHPPVMPYLTVKGANALHAFLVGVLGAEPGELHTDDSGLIIHGSVRIGASVIELSEATETWLPTQAALHVYVPDVDATYLKAMEAGAVSLDMPSDKEYGERGASVRDPFGNFWHIATYTGHRAI